MQFEELEVWKQAHGLALIVYRLSRAFPDTERYRLVDQMCRCATSIPANIAEGTGRNTLKEYLQFLYSARGSVEEMKYHLILTPKTQHLTPKT